MSATKTVIGELDVVALRNTVDDFPAGTSGTVVSMFPSCMWVEVVDESDESGFGFRNRRRLVSGRFVV
jgi:hypothetical protein